MASRTRVDDPDDPTIVVPRPSSGQPDAPAEVKETKGGEPEVAAEAPEVPAEVPVVPGEAEAPSGGQRAGAIPREPPDYLPRADLLAELQRPGPRVLVLQAASGAGATQLAALAAVLPLQRAWVLDSDHARAEAFAARAATDLGFAVEAAKDLHSAVRGTDVCVTCTPARRAFLGIADVAPGTFVAAVGADNRGKQELEPALVASATLVVDVLEQCAEIGELQHALAAGLLTREGVHAELGDVVTGRRPGRTRDDEITIFDSSGTALQDVAAAVVVYESARATGRGTEVRLDD